MVYRDTLLKEPLVNGEITSRQPCFFGIQFCRPNPIDKYQKNQYVNVVSDVFRLCYKSIVQALMDVVS